MNVALHYSHTCLLCMGTCNAQYMHLVSACCGTAMCVLVCVTNDCNELFLICITCITCIQSFKSTVIWYFGWIQYRLMAGFHNTTVWMQNSPCNWNVLLISCEVFWWKGTLLNKQNLSSILLVMKVDCSNSCVCY